MGARACVEVACRGWVENRPLPIFEVWGPADGGIPAYGDVLRVGGGGRGSRSHTAYIGTDCTDSIPSLSCSCTAAVLATKRWISKTGGRWGFNFA